MVIMAEAKILAPRAAGFSSKTLSTYSFRQRATFLQKFCAIVPKCLKKHELIAPEGLAGSKITR
jgi:hypothetical protein